VHKHWSLLVSVRAPDFSQVLVRKRRLSHVGSVDVDDVQPSGSVVGNETYLQLFVESELAFVEQADDRVDAVCFGFFDPSVNH